MRLVALKRRMEVLPRTRSIVAIDKRWKRVLHEETHKLGQQEAPSVEQGTRLFQHTLQRTCELIRLGTSTKVDKVVLCSRIVGSLNRLSHVRKSVVASLGAELELDSTGAELASSDGAGGTGWRDVQLSMLDEELAVYNFAGHVSRQLARDVGVFELPFFVNQLASKNTGSSLDPNVLEQIIWTTARLNQPGVGKGVSGVGKDVSDVGEDVSGVGKDGRRLGWLRETIGADVSSVAIDWVGAPYFFEQANVASDNTYLKCVYQVTSDGHYWTKLPSRYAAVLSATACAAGSPEAVASVYREWLKYMNDLEGVIPQKSHKSMQTKRKTVHSGWGHWFNTHVMLPVKEPERFPMTFADTLDFVRESVVFSSKFGVDIWPSVYSGAVQRIVLGSFVTEEIRKDVARTLGILLQQPNAQPYLLLRALETTGRRSMADLLPREQVWDLIMLRQKSTLRNATKAETSALVRQIAKSRDLQLITKMLFELVDVVRHTENEEAALIEMLKCMSGIPRRAAVPYELEYKQLLAPADGSMTDVALEAREQQFQPELSELSNRIALERDAVRLLGTRVMDRFKTSVVSGSTKVMSMAVKSEVELMDNMFMLDPDTLFLRCYRQLNRATKVTSTSSFSKQLPEVPQLLELTDEQVEQRDALLKLSESELNERKAQAAVFNERIRGNILNPHEVFQLIGEMQSQCVPDQRTLAYLVTSVLGTPKYPRKDVVEEEVRTMNAIVFSLFDLYKLRPNVSILEHMWKSQVRVGSPEDLEYLAQFAKSCEMEQVVESIGRF